MQCAIEPGSPLATAATTGAGSDAGVRSAHSSAGTGGGGGFSGGGFGGGGAPTTNGAFTVPAACITMRQAEAPEHAPLQPVKLEPSPPLAPNAMVVPSGNVAEQTVPQLIPAGFVTTVPSPVTVTFRV